MNNSEKTMDKIVALCKNRGFIFAGSEIYGGLANSWDYGPLGVEFKNNVKRAWWKKFVQESRYNVGLDSAIIMNPETWVASGHVGGFSDPLMDCKSCKARHRADKLIEDYAFKNGLSDNTAGWTFEEMAKYIADHGIREAVFGGNMRDINLILENLIYMEMLRRGYKITVGKVSDKEIDFIGEKQNQKIYIQAAYLLASEETIQREFGVYNHVRDNFPKYVVTMDELDMSRDGIKHCNIREFLMEDWN